MTSNGASWFHDESSLLAELRRASVALPAAPHIAGYDEVRELRRGGQGVVYTAVQRSTRRKVAVKLLLESSEGAVASRRRFEREVDLVSSLRHPRIVSVYDSGVTEDGRPYLVMEFVAGQPLDQYLRDKSWSGRSGLREVVGLIARIAEAVQYAHQRGVIHRDLKPSNVRIGDDGEPHVLDFGLARPLAHDGEATLSQSGHFVGSLAWASPEQASGDPHAIDVRTDVYSLGVMLYHAATGRFPYDVSGGLRSTLENIVTAAPARPSALVPWIDRDLQGVMLKCLEKDPSMRYQGAGELAADLRRWLDGEPVTAVVTGTWSTLRATARRHIAAVSIAAGCLVVASAIALVMTLLYVKAARAEEESSQRLSRVEAAEAKSLERLRQVEAAEAESRKSLQVADAARAEAQREAAEKDIVNQFMREMLSSADPSADGRHAKVVDMLDRAARRLESDTKLSGAVRAALQQTIGNTYVGLGMAAAAEPHLQAALDTRRELLGLDHPDTITSTVNLAYLRLHQARLDEAEKLLRSSVARAEAHLTPEQRVQAAAGHGLGMLLYDRGRWDESERVLRAALAEARSAPGEHAAAAAQIANSLAITLRHQNKLDEAEELYRTELERINAIAGPDHAFALQLMNNYGSLLHQRGRFDEAERLYRASLEGREKLLGSVHPDTISTRGNLAKFLADRERFDDALPMYAELLATARERFGAEHTTTMTILNNYAKALQDANRLEEAEQMAREVLELRNKVLGPDHPNTMISMSNLATLLAFRGKPDQSIEMQRDLLARRERKLGPNAQDTLITVNNLGLALQKSGKAEDALAYFQRATSGAEEVIGKEHWITGAFRGNLARCYGALNQFDEAERELLESHRVLIAKLGPEHAQARQAVKSLNELYTKMGKPDEAAKYGPAAAGSPK